MYHRIAPNDGSADPLGLRVTPETFTRHLTYLKDHGYRTIAFCQWTEEARRGLSPGKTAVITFDDGYVDFAQYALPLLHQFRMPATVFLVSSCLGGTNAWDRDHAPTIGLMTASQAREALKAGVEIGSHSATHRPLDTLEPADAWLELRDSKEALESLLGQEVTTFCFPYGRSSPAVRSLVQKAGYRGACGVNPVAHTLYNASRIDPARFSGGIAWRASLLGWGHRLHRSPVVRKLRAALQAPLRRYHAAVQPGIISHAHKNGRR
jgi:peptidoglycan/xylan/chitin deacetylase (PgdA/CDA1 family)